MNEFDSGTGDEPVSKSQLKRIAKARVDLGKRLATLPEGVLAQLPLDDDILEAVRFARSIKSNVAKKRQFGHLGSLLQHVDTDAVLVALEARDADARQLTARHHRAEAWRDVLLERGDGALGPLLDARHDVDAQALRQLVRNARREAAANKPPASARKLFRMLRELDEAEPLPPTAEPAG
ncbi:DUF615 domain-containing protein [Marinihelvus fidelis]|uniref:Dual-action ribosomal maturation protein DarP n=1 Tax=Marinihelvus fidelis TaxID=2613842 RepID=A0A5N0T648_9GAMM|nr:ribosome biogenesis factor YjgA [Marinihelvus fidelis]KAA9130248.1 DUF615 domain-containing protein [Marinihelvus fidelis]